MEIGHTVIMLQQIPPDGQGVALFTVKGTIYEFYLRHLPLQEIIQLFHHQVQAAEAHRLINGGQTVTAGIRTASAALVVDDPVLHSL